MTDEVLGLDAAIESNVKSVEQPQGSQSPQTTQEAIEAIEYPKTWKKDYADGWGRLDPNYQKYISEREKMFSDQSSRWGTEKQTLSSELSSFRNAFADYKESIDAGEHTYESLLQEWAYADKMIRENPALAIMNLARAHNIDLQRLAGVHPLEYQNLALQGQLSQKQWGESAREAALRAQKEQELQEILNGFTGETDESGNPLRPHFSHVEHALPQYIQLIRQQNPQLPVKDLLAQAYDRAVQDSDVVKQLEELRQLKEAQQQQEHAQKARRAAGIKTASGSTPQGPRKLDDIIEKRISRIGV